MNKSAVAVSLWLVPIPLCAQWLNFPTPGIPRTTDDKPNLTAPAPHTAEGKPDFSGLWQPGPTPYFLDVIQDPKDESIFLPAAEALFKKHLSDFRRDVLSRLGRFVIHDHASDRVRGDHDEHRDAIADGVGGIGHGAFLP